jgi:hypothetical protein
VNDSTAGTPTEAAAWATPSASCASVIVSASTSSTPAAANDVTWARWYSAASSDVDALPAAYPSPRGPTIPTIRMSPMRSCQSSATPRRKAIASWLAASSAAASSPSTAPQSGLARQVGDSSRRPAPARSAMAAYPSKYHRSSARPSALRSSGYAANSRSSTP